MVIPPVTTEKRGTAHPAHGKPPSGSYLFVLAFGALGVVYGDIGTSPLYALKESLHHSHKVDPSPANVLGILSLIFWTLVVIVSVKYLGFILRADNRGEGGILALTSLVASPDALNSTRDRVLIALGLFGTALLYGDGIITPAITVLSAVEGLNVATHVFAPYIEPIAVAILVALFAIQYRGTTLIGRIFGPVMLLWMVAIATLGAAEIARQPHVLFAINPLHAIQFVVHNGWTAFTVLGSVFLAVTGAEALYADMGHFGRRPIRLAWFAVVQPALLLNYFGQGALLISDRSAVENPFFRLAPSWAVFPLVALATAAAVIASQALISGIFSLTRQAVQLAYLPRVEIQHTSAREIGQIYIPGANWGLMIACIALVLGFRSSTHLAAAYGLAVTATMLITTALFYFLARHHWGWSGIKAGAVCGTFAVIEFAFFAANLLKIPQGGWLPIVIGSTIFLLMTTWRNGRRILAKRLRRTAPPLERFFRRISEDPPHRVPGTAVFMSGNPELTPTALLQNVRHNKVLHDRIVLLHVKTAEVPHCSDDERLKLEKLVDSFWRLSVSYGFMEEPNIPEALAQAAEHGLKIDLDATTFFLGREDLLATQRPGMAIWREKIFSRMAKNARSANRYFQLPPDRVIELGTQVEL